MKTADLVLEDGTVLEGRPFGAETDAVFELVFNTSMTGFQEILTDPTYRGQGVLFTIPYIRAGCSSSPKLQPGGACRKLGRH